MFATKKGDIQLLKTILKHKPDVNAKDSKNRNALFYAIYSNCSDNSELVLELLKSGINPNVVEIFSPNENLEGHTPLTLAAKLNFKNIIKALLDYNANPNHQVFSNSNSSLHYAILNNNQEITIALINAKANINILNKEDDTPISMALRGSNSYIYWKLANENDRLQEEEKLANLNKKNRTENVINNNIVKEDKTDFSDRHALNIIEVENKNNCNQYYNPTKNPHEKKETQINSNLTVFSNTPSNILNPKNLIINTSISENIENNQASTNYCFSNININNINININNCEGKT